jgi:hypothetical protein
MESHTQWFNTEAEARAFCEGVEAADSDKVTAEMFDDDDRWGVELTYV